MKRLPRARVPWGTWGTDDASCDILHVDMDAFFAMVELRDRPELQGLPVIVGGGDRGVVLSATYEARAFGVNSAMPMTRARRICPQAVVIPPSHGTYHEVSASVMELFRSLTPLVEPLSVDEAFLDVGGARRRVGSPVEVARMIRERVFAEHRITCSVGVATTKFVAKLASTAAKPDGLLLIAADATAGFLRSLPVGSLWGVGARTEELLARWGMTTVAEVADADPRLLTRAVGEAAGRHLHELANGRDPRPVTVTRVEKSMGAETTFPTDTSDAVVLKATLLELADRCAARLRAHRLRGRTVSVKIRRADFSTFTRARTLERASDVASEIYGAAAALFDEAPIAGDLIRLLGIRVESLTPADAAPEQLAFDFDGSGDPGVVRSAEVAMDRVRERFGKGSVGRGTLIPGNPAFRHGQGDLSLK